MFERYTEKARRVIFFARYEASQFGSHYIDTEHLLLGLLREDRAVSQRFFPQPGFSAETVRQSIAQRISAREKISTSVDLPLSNESKRVLTYAAQEAERLKHSFIGTEHLLLGLLQEKKGMAAEILAPLSLDPQTIRALIKEPSSTPYSSEKSRYGADSSTYFGKYRAVVLDNLDPEQLGRLLVKAQAVGGPELNWASPCTPYPIAGVPALAVPPVGASVWVEFEGGDIQYPIWSGCFWSAGQPPLLKLP